MGEGSMMFVNKKTIDLMAELAARSIVSCKEYMEMHGIKTDNIILTSPRELRWSKILRPSKEESD